LRIGARRRRGVRPLGGIEQLKRRGGTVDGGGADLAGVGEGGHFAHHAAQAEAGGDIIVGGLQPAIVEAERLVDGVLKVKLPVVMGSEVLVGEALGLGRIERPVEKRARVCVHAACGASPVSAGPPSSTKRRSQ
jgi:hypothetical protein